MQVKRTYTICNELAKKIIDDYNNHHTMRFIASKYNIPYNRVNSVLIANKIKKRTTSDTSKLSDYNRKSHFLDGKTEICDELKRLYSDGLSLTEIGTHFNVSHVTIKNWLIKLEVKLRTILESNSGERSKESKQITMRKKYGVDNPMQLVDIHYKAMKSGYRLKTVNINDRIFHVQGYEPQAIKYLVSEGVNVNSILTGVDVPTIAYVYRGKNKTYFPDFFIRETNTVYEIKSVWTYSQQQSKNVAKAQSTANKGYKHITLIFDNKGINLVNTIITT